MSGEHIFYFALELERGLRANSIYFLGYPPPRTAVRLFSERAQCARVVPIGYAEPFQPSESTQSLRLYGPATARAPHRDLAPISGNLS